MNKLSIIFFISTVLSIEKSQGSTVYYLDEHHQFSNSVVRLNSLYLTTSSLRLQASKRLSPKSGQYAITVKAPTVGNEYFMLVNVPKFNLRRTISDKCVDVITIRNVYNGEIIYRGCWSNVTSSFKTGGTDTNSVNQFIVELELGNSINLLDGFEMVFTMSRKCSYARSSQFRCWDGYCIHSALKCDKEVNCLDGSDEAGSTCSSNLITDKGGSGTSIKVGIPIGTIIFIVVVIACYAKCRRNSQTVETTVYIPRTQPVPVPPPTNTEINIINITAAPRPAPPRQPQNPDPNHTNQYPPPYSPAYQPTPYPPSHEPYPPQTTPYPPQTTPYPPQTTPYPPQTTPYPPQTTPYPPQTTPYPPQTTPYPPQPSQFGAQPQFNPVFEREAPFAPAYGKY